MKCSNCGAEFEGAFCPQCGIQATYNQVPSHNQTKTGKPKKKKPIYKRWWFIAMMIIVLIVAVKTIKTSINEKIDWSKVEMCDVIPKPNSKRGKISSNTENELYVELYKTSEENYKSYVSQCKESGFKIDSELGGSSYEAYNKAGYKISIDYYDYNNKMTITAEAPMKFTKIHWPDSKVGKLLPLPKSSKGNFLSEYEDSFAVYISNTTKADFKEYVSACSGKGFNVDYNKNDTYYYAKNSEGYELTVEYEGNKIMRISIDSPSKDESEEKTTKQNSEKTTEKVETETSKSETTGIRKEFKEAMDSYEEFMNKYVAFIKKYSESDGTDLQIISDYAEYMKKYSDMEKKFDKWKDEDLNDEELAYYIDVQARVSKKLLEVS